MRSLLFLILAGYAVRCDDARSRSGISTALTGARGTVVAAIIIAAIIVVLHAAPFLKRGVKRHFCRPSSYYVIEMPEEAKEYAKPFRVYWNVPTMQCKSKKIPFLNLFEKFGIIQNSEDSFRGDKVAILYDPGQFPALLKNETSGKFVFRNGGVPQEGNLEQHLKAFRIAVEQSIPSQNFSGIGIIDFESWRPVFRQNFGVLVPYKDISYQIERKLHWFWSERAIQARARQRFEEAARVFMQTTISVAKQMRPKAQWGYYGFPYCFNMATNNMVEKCSDQVGQENDRLYWLWSESTALYPSIYSSKELTSAQLAAMARGRVAEAARAGRGAVLPYFWFRYRDGGFLSQTDLGVILDTLYKSDASGFIIWGSSNDVNTVDKCNDLLKFTEDIMGPAIAKYTREYYSRNTTDLDSISNPVSSLIGLTTRPILKNYNNNSNSSNQPFEDPEYIWFPPENYTQDIVHYVEQELKRKLDRNDTEENQTELHVKKNSLLDMILNIFKHDQGVIDNATAISIDSGTTTVRSNYSYMPNIVTKNPLDDIINKAGIDNSKQTTLNSETYFSSTAKFNNYLSTTNPSHTTSEVIAYTEKLNDTTENISYESSTAFYSSENNTNAESNNNINKEELLPFWLNYSTTIEQSTEMSELSTYSNNIENITETISYTENQEVVTSQELTDVPLSHSLDDNLSTTDESPKAMTASFADNMPTSSLGHSYTDSPYVTSETFTILDQTSTDNVYKLETNIGESDLSKETSYAQNISLHTNHTTVSASNEGISSTESTTNMKSDESTPKTIDDSTKNTTELVDFTYREDFHGNENENFSIETNTADGFSTTTDAVPQVVVFL